MGGQTLKSSAHTKHSQNAGWGKDTLVKESSKIRNADGDSAVIFENIFFLWFYNKAKEDSMMLTLMRFESR